MGRTSLKKMRAVTGAPYLLAKCSQQRRPETERVAFRHPSIYPEFSTSKTRLGFSRTSRTLGRCSPHPTGCLL